MRKIKNYTTREDFLENVYKKGLKKYPELQKHFMGHKSPIKDFEELVLVTMKAEEEGILYCHKNKKGTLENFKKQVRWYLQLLERKGKIKGFIGKVGRPKKYFSF